MAQSTRVFISYSQDSREHIWRVIELADRLREDGVDAQLDRYVEAPSEGWPRWVEGRIAASDFIICICSDLYRKSFEGRNDPQKGLGVNQEGFLILQDLFDNGNCSEKYIPVVFPQYFTRESVPAALRSFQHYKLPEEYEALYRRVTRQPLVRQPSLGSIRKLSPLAVLTNTVDPLSKKSEGFEGQSEITEFLSPEHSFFEKLAPHDGLFLSRLINPQTRAGNNSITTVWVSARGPLDYVLDSIRILDYPRLPLGGNPVVSIPPDAEYRFTYAEGSDRVHALNPALAVGPSTRNWALFTVGTAMEKGFYYLGDLFIWVHYHASDGRTGTLLLSALSDDMRKLSKLIAADVAFPMTHKETANFGMVVITPEGLQKGFEPEHSLRYCFIPISFPNYSGLHLGRSGILIKRTECRDALEKRSGLNDALKDDRRREELAKWLTQGSLMAADLLGSAADENSTATLLQAFSHAQPDAALFGLCVRHLVTGDGLLAKLVLENKITFHDDKQIFNVIYVLMLRPAGDWLDVLWRFKKINMSDAGYTRSILEVLEPDMTSDEKSWILNSAEGPLICEIFVRGSMNNWTKSKDTKLAYNGDGLYKTTLRLKPGRYEFKIADATWNIGNLGGKQAGLKVIVEDQIELFHNSLSHNLEIQIEEDAPAGYTFTVDARSLTNLKLTISRD